MFVYVLFFTKNKIFCSQKHNARPKYLPLSKRKALLWNEEKCRLNLISGILGAISSHGVKITETMMMVYIK